MPERKDFEVQRRARSDEEPQRVEQRSEDGDHDKSVSKNGGNLKGRNRYGVSGRDKLVLDKHGFGHHRTGAAGTGEPGDCHQQMQKEDGQIAHRSILARSRSAPQNAHEFRIRHAQLG
jgi:hypothetical protein